LTSKARSMRTNGIQAALLSALFLGLAPVFGKLAISVGFPPLAVVALRTALATLLLLAVVLAFRRRYLYIYPAGLLGCLLAGGINGLGSLLYYSALGRIDAGVGQLIYSLYPLFVAMWLWLDHQPPNKLTIFRLALATIALVLLTQAGGETPDLIGMAMMLGASALYALHLPINQRVLYEMPAPTVTLYTLFAMSAVVVPAYFLAGAPAIDVNPDQLSLGWWAVLALTLVTFFSRLTLFLGVKHLGGLQTAILGLGELFVTILFAHILLGEQLSIFQWLGAFLLAASLILVTQEKIQIQHPNLSQGWLRWLHPPNIPPDIP
jgi:drug/metabolite transporter (DMT)-like permease